MSGTVLQHSLAPTDRGHAVKVAVPDLTLKGRDDPFLAGKEVRSCQIHAGDRVVGDEGAVAGEVLHKELQLFQQLFFRERIEFPVLGFRE